MATIVGCASAPQKFSDYKSGTWQGKVLIRDKREQHNAIISLSVKAIDGSSLRADITSPTGTHLASLLIKNSEVEYLNVSERTVYKSKSEHGSLQALLRAPLEAGLLFNILFDRAPTEKNWSCASDERGQVKSCRDQKSGLKVDWVRRERDQRTIEIDHSSANLQMSLFGFEPNVSEPEKAFELKVPSSFKTKKL